MMLTDTNQDAQCQICFSKIFIGDERCIVHHDNGDFLACILCGATAEKLGWCISV